jgi:hypothetical protein
VANIRLSPQLLFSNHPFSSQIKDISSTRNHRLLITAREGRTRKSENKVTTVESKPQRRSPRLSDTAAPNSYRYVKETSSSSVQRAARETPVMNALKPAKTKQKVSIAGVFKKPQKSKNSRAGKKQRRRENTPELDLVGELQGVSCL